MKIRTKMLNTTKKEVTQMKKGLIILMAVSMLFAMGSMALAANDITPNSYDLTGAVNGNPAKDYQYYEQGEATSSGTYAGSTPAGVYQNSTHVYGTWNSPYTLGVDGYNYNDAQDYTDDGAQVANGKTSVIQFPVYGANMEIVDFGTMNMPQTVFTSGPHGGYLTSTHRCRECHAVHRAAGKFKLLRSDTRFEACDWCHGTGAGSGFNIQMDNDDNYTTEYNVGHTMGFGVSTGKWKAPDDTYPAFTPNYWQGGFSCFDCHSPHANPARLLGYDAAGIAIPSIVNTATGEVYNIGNPGHDLYTSGGKGYAPGGSFVPALGFNLPASKSKPYYLAGSWLLIKNPDREMATSTTAVVTNPIQSWVPNIDMGQWGTAGLVNGGSYVNDPDITITAGQEISDAVTTKLYEFDASTSYPVNKVPIDWNNPIGSASLWDEDYRALAADMPAGNDDVGYTTRNPFCRSLILDEFCTDCHDGNAGFHTEKAPLFSEDRALRSSAVTSGGDGNTLNDRANYDLAYGHDSNVRH